MTKLLQTKRELDHALAALADGGSGAAGTLECRVASLQQALLDTPATSLDDIEARLQVIRTLAAGLGEPGYLLHLIGATLSDVHALQAAGKSAGGRRGAGDSPVSAG
jgi:hypothetical protein